MADDHKRIPQTLRYRDSIKVASPSQNSDAIVSAYYLPISNLTSARIHRISDYEWTIGRDRDSTFVLTHQGASFEHAAVEKDSIHKLHVLTDYASTNGTVLNGLYTRRAFLHNGDRIDVPGGRFFYYQCAERRIADAEGLESILNDDYRRSCLEIESPNFIVFRVNNYHALVDAFEFRALRAMSEHLSAVLSQLFPFARIEALREGFEYVLVSTETGRSSDQNALIRAIERLTVADIGDDHSVSLDLEFAVGESTKSAVSRLRSRARRSKTPDLRFDWVHLSDLHVGAGGLGWQMDQQVVISAIARDLQSREQGTKFDRMFVTGDVTFSGRLQQFADAKLILQDLLATAGLEVSQLRVVPGNHDVQRDLAAQPVTAALHAQVRQKETLLDTYLADERGRQILLEKLAAFSQFVASIPGHPKSRDALDWIEECAVGDRLIRIFGLCSTWVSDAGDGRGKDSFSPNIALPHRAISEVAAARSRSAATLVLTHHPESWLLPFSRRLLRDTLSATGAVHLCGHVHEVESNQRITSGGYSQTVMNAGSSHSDPAEPPKHTYCWGSLRWDEAANAWKLGWSPRVFVPSRNEMRADTVTYNLDADEYCWQQLVSPPQSRNVTIPPSSHNKTGTWDLSQFQTK